VRRPSWTPTSRVRTQALFYCVRVSTNGRRIKQLCDPGTGGNGTGAMTGAVRAAVEEAWNDLKRGHFLDARSRVLSLQLQLKSNNEGVRYRITLMFELTSLGAILPSYDVETRILDRSIYEPIDTYANIALAMVSRLGTTRAALGRPAPPWDDARTRAARVASARVSPPPPPPPPPLTWTRPNLLPPREAPPCPLPSRVWLLPWPLAAAFPALACVAAP
jgi:hypothetical protein